MIALTEVLLFVTSVLVALFFWTKHHFSYWRRKNVAYIEPNPLFGNLKEMVTMSRSAADHLKDLYDHNSCKNEAVVGIHIFNKPALLVREPEVIKSILIKDFYKFSNRFSSCDPHGDALGSNNLFFIKNPEWKEMRSKLTPVFTSGKMKQTFPLVEQIGSQLDKYLCDLKMDPQTKSCVKEIKEINALYSTDVIASVAFGLEANSLKNPNGEFRRNGRSIFNFTLLRAIEWSVVFFLPQLVSVLRCKMFSTESSKFLRDTINFVIAERIKNGNTRNDLIDILVAFKKASETGEKKPIENDVLVAQAAIFFTAGYETSSSTMSFGLYELSKKPDLQNRLRVEITEALKKNNGKVSYEMLNEMEYLNMFVQEVLRLYPPLPFLDRECTLPKDDMEYSLKPYSEFAVPHNMPVYIPIYGIQRDPQYFPNPEEFDPERFSAENKLHIKPFTYMPFGTGPHNCIGERFGILQTKIGLINFLRNHYVTTCEKSHQKMVLDPKALIIQSKGGIYCKIVRDPLA